jgi:phospholipid/cholesterol/gamma-HCH transport system ATP-binding protein
MSFNGQDFVLDDISLQIPSGQITVIIGFSGAGKTVLLKLILGLFQPISGSIKVLGQEITTMNPAQLLELRQHYGMLFQDSALFDDMNVLENVVFPLLEHRSRWTEIEMIAFAKERLKEAGLEEKDFGKLPATLSGGMRKRVALARALALDPEILIYDEPTSSLDPVLTEMVDQLIVKTEDLKKGTTSLVVSHDLFGAFKMATHIVMLDAGKVLLYGTPDEFQNSKLETVQKFLDQGLHRPEKIPLPAANTDSHLSTKSSLGS